MRSKHPELRELAYAAYAAIRRWEEGNEKKDLNGDHLRGDHRHADRRERIGLAEPDGSGHISRSGAGVDRDLCHQQ